MSDQEEENPVDGAEEVEEAGDEYEDAEMGESEAAGSDDEVDPEAEVHLDLLPEHIDTMKKYIQWSVDAMGSTEELGRLIYDALFTNVGPADRVLFKTPKDVTAVRFITQFVRLVDLADDEEKLMEDLVAMSMRHISYITVAEGRRNLLVFVNAILSTLRNVLDEEFDDFGAEAFTLLLSFVGEVLLRNVGMFAAKVTLVRRSWKTLSAMSTTSVTTKNEWALDGTEVEEVDLVQQALKVNREADAAKKQQEVQLKKKQAAKGRNQGEDDKKGAAAGSGEDGGFGHSLYFNLGVMAPEIASLFQSSRRELAPQFVNAFGQFTELISDPASLQEVLFILAMRHLKYGARTELFPVFGQAVMVTLRSMLPRVWDYKHEEAWTWVWDTVSGQMGKVLANGARNKQLIDDSSDRLQDIDMLDFGMKFYQKLFSISPLVSNAFYKPISVIKFLVERTLWFLSTLPHEPATISQELRALGMRHIKYNIPSALFPLFGQALLHTLSVMLEGFWTDDTEEAWATVFDFACRTMTRAVSSGSNLVTRSVVNKSLVDLEVALRSAPRKERALWLLEVNVSGQTLSPLYWSIHDGHIEIAQFMLQDLLAIRADRETYYCGKDDLFRTHPGVVKTLSVLAASLLPDLFDGLMWQSRQTERSQRRVNYYIRDVYGNPSLARYADAYKTPLADLAHLRSPTVFTHPLVGLLVNCKWSGFARKQYFLEQALFVTLLVLSMIAYVGLPQIDSIIDPNKAVTDPLYTYMKVMRIIVVVLSNLLLIFSLLRRLLSEYRKGQTAQLFTGSQLRLPLSFFRATFCGRLVVAVLLMCTAASDVTLTGGGPVSASVLATYRWTLGFALLLQWALLVELFAVSLSLVQFRFQLMSIAEDVVSMLTTMVLFLLGTAAGYYFGQLAHDHNVESGTSRVQVYLTGVSFLLGNQLFFPSGNGALMQMSFFFIVFLGQLALLTVASGTLTSRIMKYSSDIRGYTTLQRCVDVVDVESNMSQADRQRQYDRLQFDRQIEFDEFDLGLKGGLQVLEPAAKFEANDRIVRYPGQADPAVPWPVSEKSGFDMSTQLQDITAVTRKMWRTLREMTKGTGAGASTTGGSTSGAGSSHGSAT